MKNLRLKWEQLLIKKYQPAPRVLRDVQPYYVVLTPSLSLVDLDWKSMTRGGEGEVSPCYSGISMPSWMEQESLWEAPRTQSTQWNIKKYIT
jgi:hypothetical protein